METNSQFFHVAGNPDILICGNCREMFTDLGELLEHKRNYCKLRFTCKCHTFNGTAPSTQSKERSTFFPPCIYTYTREWVKNDRSGSCEFPSTFLRFPLRNFSIKNQAFVEIRGRSSSRCLKTHINPSIFPLYFSILLSLSRRC